MNSSMYPSRVVSGFIALAGLTIVQAWAADVDVYGVVKGREYTQFEASVPADATSVASFYAFVRPTAADLVTMASVQAPGVVPVPFPLETDGGLQLQFELQMPTTEQLEMLLPNGTYTVSMSTANDGERTASLNLTGNNYPNTPTFSNFAALGAINPAVPLVLSWSAFTGGTANDFILVEVTDSNDETLFATPDIGLPGALNGTATSVTIPANTLPADGSGTIYLTFARVLARNTTAYPGAVGVVGYFKSTTTTFSTTGGGGTTDTTPPVLLNSVPAIGVAGVPVNSPIAFTFSEPMTQAQAIAWSANVNPANFSYNWNSDGRTLVCVPTTPLPANALITWALNPSGQTPRFADLAGNPLAADTHAGYFLTGGGGGTTNNPCQPGGDRDGRGFGTVGKDLFYLQTSSSAPLLQTNGARFLGLAMSPSNNVLTAARVQVPGGPQVILSNIFLSTFLAEENYPTQAALDAARPGGTYTLQLTRADASTPSIPVALTGNFPPTPQILNYDAAQSVNTNADFVLQWNAFTGVTPQDSLEITLQNGDWWWSAPDPCVPRPLTNTATSIAIPAGTLYAATTYEGTLTFSRHVASNTNAVSDMVASTFLRKTVTFQLRTAGGTTADRGRFTLYRFLPGGNFEVTLQGTPGATYVIEASSNLVTWTEVYRGPASAAGLLIRQLVPTPGQNHVFYRARPL